ncbi:O-antigen ligase like membrane protein [Dyadobacter soli]|uniref:O-antigen ligase like membrane protein n=1 Tax=Dyadobacter soli TaxID=659014 RepID=A0A1G6YBF2_9BACT|nr:O-antigen ligase family protein [Dyadobacter soli]SDD87601.1 O-antigen ligase like membrane protein [Dyadobacter soli]
MISFIFLFIFIATAVVSYYRIQTGFALVVAFRLLIPPVVRIDLKVAEISLNSCFILMIIGITILNFITKKLKVPPFTRSTLKPLALFLGASLVLTFLGGKLTAVQSISSLMQFIYTEVTLGVIGWIIYNQEEDIRQFVKIIGYSVVLMGVYGLFCYVTLTNPYVSLMNLIYSPKMNALGFMEEQRAGIAGRIQGTMLHPLIWGGACMLLFYFITLSSRRASVYYTISLLALLFLNVVFSGSRAALLALLFGIGYYFMASNVRLKLRLVAYGLGIFTFVAGLIYLVPSFSKYQSFFESTVYFWDDTYQKTGAVKGSTVDLRVNQLHGSFDMIESSPMFGLGQGYTAYYSSKYGIHPVLAGFESVVFMSLVETGIVGLILWIALFIGLFRVAHELSRRAGKSLSLETALLSTFLASYCIFIVFTGIQSTFYLFLILFLVQVKNIRIKLPARKAPKPALAQVPFAVR